MKKKLFPPPTTPYYIYNIPEMIFHFLPTPFTHQTKEHTHGNFKQKTSITFFLEIIYLTTCARNYI